MSTPGRGTHVLRCGSSSAVPTRHPAAPAGGMGSCGCPRGRHQCRSSGGRVGSEAGVAPRASLGSPTLLTRAAAPAARRCFHCRSCRGARVCCGCCLIHRCAVPCRTSQTTTERTTPMMWRASPAQPHKHVSQHRDSHTRIHCAHQELRTRRHNTALQFTGRRGAGRRSKSLKKHIPVRGVRQQST